MRGRRSTDGGRRGATRRGTAVVNPLLALASNAWRAEDVSMSGGNTTQWNPFIGAVALTPPGSPQAQPAALAGLNNRQAVPFAAAGNYSGLITAPGLDQTLMFVTYITGNNSGLGALTLAGAGNTGTSVYSTLNIAGRRSGVSGGDKLSGGFSIPQAVVSLIRYTANDITLYVNARTGLVGSLPGGSGYSQATFTLGALDMANTFPLTGSIALAAVIPSAVTQAQAEALLSFYGAYYGVAIGA